MSIQHGMQGHQLTGGGAGGRGSGSGDALWRLDQPFLLPGRLWLKFSHGWWLCDSQNSA